MGIRLSPKRKMTNFHGYKHFLKNWDWQWSVTLTFSDRYENVSFEQANKMAIKWLRRICISEKIQLGSFYSLCKLLGRVHIHLLIIGYARIEGRVKTLFDTNILKWEKAWPCIAEIKIIPEDEIPYAAQYLAAQFIKNDECEIESYNQKFLKKVS